MTRRRTAAFDVCMGSPRTYGRRTVLAWVGAGVTLLASAAGQCTDDAGWRFNGLGCGEFVGDRGPGAANCRSEWASGVTADGRARQTAYEACQITCNNREACEAATPPPPSPPSSPEVVLADPCGCPAGYGWSVSTGVGCCKPGSVTSAAAEATCRANLGSMNCVAPSTGHSVEPTAEPSTEPAAESSGEAALPVFFGIILGCVLCPIVSKQVRLERTKAFGGAVSSGNSRGQFSSLDVETLPLTTQQHTRGNPLRDAWAPPPRPNPAEPFISHHYTVVAPAIVKGGSTKFSPVIGSLAVGEQVCVCFFVHWVCLFGLRCAILVVPARLQV